MTTVYRKIKIRPKRALRPEQDMSEDLIETTPQSSLPTHNAPKVTIEPPPEVRTGPSPQLVRADPQKIATNIVARVVYDPPYFLVEIKNSRFAWNPFTPWVRALHPETKQQVDTPWKVRRSDAPGTSEAKLTTTRWDAMQFNTYAEAEAAVRGLGVKLS